MDNSVKAVGRPQPSMGLGAGLVGLVTLNYKQENSFQVSPGTVTNGKYMARK